MVDCALKGEVQKSNGQHQTSECMIDNCGHLQMEEDEEEEQVAHVISLLNKQALDQEAKNSSHKSSTNAVNDRQARKKVLVMQMQMW